MMKKSTSKAGDQDAATRIDKRIKELGQRELHPKVGGEAEMGERLGHLRQAQLRVGGEAHLQAEERGDDPIDDGRNSGIGSGGREGWLPQG